MGQFSTRPLARLLGLRVRKSPISDSDLPPDLLFGLRPRWLPVRLAALLGKPQGCWANGIQASSHLKSPIPSVLFC